MRNWHVSKAVSVPNQRGFVTWASLFSTILLLKKIGSVFGSKLVKLHPLKNKQKRKQKLESSQIQKNRKWTLIQTGWIDHIKGKRKVINHVCLINEEFAPAFLHALPEHGWKRRGGTTPWFQWDSCPRRVRWILTETTTLAIFGITLALKEM